MRPSVDDTEIYVELYPEGSCAVPSGPGRFTATTESVVVAEEMSFRGAYRFAISYVKLTAEPVHIWWVGAGAASVLAVISRGGWRSAETTAEAV